jgi:hypothetical protein
MKLKCMREPSWSEKAQPVNPKKVVSIKAEVEKLLHAQFIYLVPLTEWVSNLILVAKKHGTIRVCVDYRDLNKSCPKDNYPTPFIDHIIDECVRSEIFSFMDGFSGYNQIRSNWKINTRLPSFVLGVLFLIESFHLVLKMLEPPSSGPCLTHFMTSNIL